MALLIPNTTCATLATRVYEALPNSYWDTTWTNGCSFAASLVTDKALLLVFRGTVPTNICSWETDIDAIPPYEDEHVGPVHRGFGLSVAALWPEILTFTLARPLLPIAVIGHSMGASEAGICAGKLIRTGRDIAQLTTFGCPNTVFHSNNLLPGLLKSIPGDDWRNGPDQVPYEPRILFGHWRPMTQIGDPSFRLDWIDFHLIAAYGEAIAKLSVNA